MGKVMRHTLGASLNIRHNLSSSKGPKPLQLKLLTTYIPKTSAFTLAFSTSQRLRTTRASARTFFTPLPTVNTTGYIDHAAFLGTINPDTNKIPKHLFQGYLNIYNNYFKAPWMPDRTEANPNELNQDDARYGFRCCHLKNIWTAPLPPETELSRQMTTSTTSIDIM